MKDYVIINGVSSKTKQGLGINILPPIAKPTMRTIKEEIDGRDGDIITKLGYSAYDKTIEIGLFGNGYDVNDIIAFFNQEGTITFSNEPDKYYYFSLIDDFNIERLINFKTSKITFHCQPFKYLLNEAEISFSPIVLAKNVVPNTRFSKQSVSLNMTGYTIQELTNGITGSGLFFVIRDDDSNALSFRAGEGSQIAAELSAFHVNLYKPDDTLYDDLDNTHIYFYCRYQLLGNVTKLYVIADLSTKEDYGSIQNPWDNVYVMNKNTNTFSSSAMWDCMVFGEGNYPLFINNIGNVISKPQIYIKGTGTIGVYLEGTQIFSVDLTDEIVIDVENLESYDPSNMSLMNRSVTGNISNFILKPGTNIIEYTGNVEKIIISNYTRWL